MQKLWFKVYGLLFHSYFIYLLHILIEVLIPSSPPNLTFTTPLYPCPFSSEKDSLLHEYRVALAHQVSAGMCASSPTEAIQDISARGKWSKGRQLSQRQLLLQLLRGPHCPAPTSHCFAFLFQTFNKSTVIQYFTQSKILCLMKVSGFCTVTRHRLSTHRK